MVEMPMRLTVRQNLYAILETMSLSRKERRLRCEQLLEQFGLKKVESQLARTLSGGERRKLEIARALVTNPTMILLDEPFSGVDPIAVEELQHEIRGLKDRGISRGRTRIRHLGSSRTGRQAQVFQICKRPIFQSVIKNIVARNSGIPQQAPACHWPDDPA